MDNNNNNGFYIVTADYTYEGTASQWIFTDRDRAANAENNAELVAFYNAGKIRPHVSGHFALADAGTAIKALAGRRALGKLVVTLD